MFKFQSHIIEPVSTAEDSKVFLNAQNKTLYFRKDICSFSPFSVDVENLFLLFFFATTRNWWKFTKIFCNLFTFCRIAGVFLFSNKFSILMMVFSIGKKCNGME